MVLMDAGAGHEQREVRKNVKVHLELVHWRPSKRSEMVSAFRGKRSMALGAVLLLSVAVPLEAGASTVSRPSAPRSVHAVAGNASATVSWLKPSSSGGAPIKSYLVTSHPSGKTCSSKVLKCRVSGLHNGTAYTFTVVAKNTAGVSPRSTPSNRVTPKAPASSPMIVVSPNVDLTNGQAVKVSGSGFKPGDQVYLVECLRTSTGQGGCDIATATPVTISSSGVLPSTTFNVVTGTVGTGSCGTSSSNLNACDISAGNASGGDSTSAPITFK